MSIEQRKNIFGILPNPVDDVLELVTNPRLFLLHNASHTRDAVRESIKTILDLSDEGYRPSVSLLIGFVDTIGAFFEDKYKILS